MFGALEKRKGPLMKKVKNLVLSIFRDRVFAFSHLTTVFLST